MADVEQFAAISPQWAKPPGKPKNLTVVADVAEDSITDTVEAAAMKGTFVIV